MFKSRISADLIATFEGLIWLILAWSISISIWTQNNILVFFAIILTLLIVLSAWLYKPFRINMQRFRARRRRTEMLMHLFALPILLALFLAVIVETLLSTTLNGLQKTLLVNAMATAGWIFFILTQSIKQLHFAIYGKKTNHYRR